MPPELYPGWPDADTHGISLGSLVDGPRQQRRHPLADDPALLALCSLLESGDTQGAGNRPINQTEDYMENGTKNQPKEPVYKASRPTGFTCSRCGVVERDQLFCSSCFRCEKCCTCIKDKE